MQTNELYKNKWLIYYLQLHGGKLTVQLKTILLQYINNITHFAVSAIKSWLHCLPVSLSQSAVFNIFTTVSLYILTLGKYSSSLSSHQLLSTFFLYFIYIIKKIENNIRQSFLVGLQSGMLQQRSPAFILLHQDTFRKFYSQCFLSSSLSVACICWFLSGVLELRPPQKHTSPPLMQHCWSCIDTADRYQTAWRLCSCSCYTNTGGHKAAGLWLFSPCKLHSVYLQGFPCPDRRWSHHCLDWAWKHQVRWWVQEQDRIS